MICNSYPCLFNSTERQTPLPVKSLRPFRPLLLLLLKTQTVSHICHLFHPSPPSSLLVINSFVFYIYESVSLFCCCWFSL